MKELIIDLLYQGYFMEGSTAGKYPLSMLPLDKGELERIIIMDNWIIHWWRTGDLVTLNQ